MQVEPFLIEPQRARDRPRVLALLQQVRLPIDDLHAGGAPVDFLVMRELGQVVGAVGLQSADGAGLLRSLVVQPSLHRQGRGAALVGAAERLAARRGMDDLYLLTTTAPGFFALLDYLRVDRATVPLALQRTSQFASLCPQTAVCMHKRLRLN
jgi:amino-acid N-acetyltransferase